MFEAHETPDERVIACVRAIGVFPAEPVIETMLRVRPGLAHVEPQIPQSRRADGDEKRRVRFDAGSEVGETPPDEIAAGEPIEIGQCHGSSVSNRPAAIKANLNAMRDYEAKHNRTSIDGLPALS